MDTHYRRVAVAAEPDKNSTKKGAGANPRPVMPYYEMIRQCPFSKVAMA